MGTHIFTFLLHSLPPLTRNTSAPKFDDLIVQRKDPEGVLGPPQTGHLARLEFKRRLERDAEAREAFQRQVREEKERRQALRQVILSLLSHFLIFFPYFSLDLYGSRFGFCSLGLFRIRSKKSLSTSLTLKPRTSNSRLRE